MRTCFQLLRRGTFFIASLAAAQFGPSEAANAAPLRTKTLDVLTYNIEGLAWPARRGRGPSLGRIGHTLAELRRSGQAPDVVLIQEMFSPAARRAIEAAGYPYMAVGPARTQRTRMEAAEKVPGPWRIGKGEIGWHVAGSGLAVLSRYPIMSSASEPFGTRRCAGLDCLSNKGLLHVRIAIPGVPTPIDLFDTHLNSQRASRASLERRTAAHRIQVEALRRFIDAKHDANIPIILGGDFNMKHSEIRFETFSAINTLELVHDYCGSIPNRCDVRVSWDGDAPWMDTQDLQLFKSGSRVSIVPVRVQALFDGSDGSPKLSDHDGFRVRYRLDW